MERKTLPLQLKEITQAGTFEGYASIFDNVDLGGDVIRQGAFKEFDQDSDGKVVVLLQHDSRDLPIGKATVSQDEKGLKFVGELVMDDPFVRDRVLPHMKARTLRGMSIGYDVIEGGAKVLESGVRELTALKLWEISPVIWGMNPKAGIDAVKHAPLIKTITDFERFLREVGGFSHSAAKALAAGGFKAMGSPRDAGDLSDAIKRLKTTAQDAANLKL